MNKICIFLGMTVFGWLGWWVGENIGFMTAFVLSGIASIVGNICLLDHRHAPSADLRSSNLAVIATS